ncbi:MAG: protein TolR [Deltaproteobacteria bacterium]|nr:protein TolR [Deltaproteobacteria bacterium]
MKVLHAGSRHNQPLAEINVVPFVDIVLVLLIIFMITAPLLQQGLPVELPKAEAQEIKREKKDLVVTIDAKGNIFLGDVKQALNLEAFTAKLAAIFKTKEDKALLIRADHQLSYGAVVDVMSTALKVGVQRIGMITQPEK